MKKLPPYREVRYAVLHHVGHGEPHYDLLIGREDEPLVTFRLPCWPVVSRVEITPLPDHRPLYLTYEGPVSGGRGEVRRVEAGTTGASPEWLREAGEQRVVVITPLERDGQPLRRRLNELLRFTADRRQVEPVAHAHQG